MTPGGAVGSKHATPDHYAGLPERIIRTCLTCGYSWPEAPMDGGADVLLRQMRDEK